MQSFREMPVEQLATLGYEQIGLAWQDASKELAALKLRETLLRMLFFNRCFPEPKFGTNHFQLGQGFLLKATYPQTFKVADTPEMEKALEQFDPIIQERLIKWSPELKVGEWNKLTEDQRLLFAEHVTSKPGMPQLEILAPGDPGNKK